MATAGLRRRAKRRHFLTQGKNPWLARSQHQAETVLAAKPVRPLQTTMIEAGLKAVANQGFCYQMCQTFHLGSSISPRKKRAASPLCEAFSTTWSSNCCRFPWGCPGKPDRETATALFQTFRCLASGIPAALTPSLSWRGGAGHLGHDVRPCFLTFTCSYLCIAPSPFPEAFTALWDGNSTPARCGCQEVITIYCISKQ